MPTIAESGYPEFSLVNWYVLLVPAGTPPAVIARLNREIVRILSEPEVKQRWTPIGIEPRPTSPEEFARLVVDEIRKAGVEARVQILSFDWRTLQVAQRLAPQVPQAAGAMVPLEIFPEPAHTIAYLTPQAWAIQGLREVALRGGSVVDVIQELGVLVLYAVALMAIGTWQFRRILTR